MRAKRAGESSTPRTSTPLNRSGASLRICLARVRIALLVVCQEIPRAAATRQTDMHYRARARSPHSTAERVSRALGSAKLEVSCLHTRRQWVQAKRRRRTTSCVGLHPTGTWARRRPTSPPLGAAGLAEGVLEPDRHAALDHRALGCEVLAHRGYSQGVQAQEGRQIRVGEGSLRHVEVSQVACVAAPIIGGPRPLPGVTTRPPHLYTSIGFTYHTPKREEPVCPLIAGGWHVKTPDLGVL